MNKHTPGPWKKFDSAFPQFFVCVEGKDICKVSSGDVTLLEAEANANLIAAAPELLAALEAVVAIADRDTEEFNTARVIIAKAKGITQ